ncbi:nucleoside triphosphate pyrophosphohydrolase [Alkalihalobacillus sp. LMS39]|uniref:nucleoside triphosphate pyrophosphohydrolase n=1 Tax=Alkalihalobacillus sp. LMS39 TaxID=2924032 RepID=UPI001FB51312|nr:nucleoside triphosphate pyrophosphohydrolase [Alkalihalobacillus sp. LMS39]UOE94196.1 nucleoside triphosphate pyrophosphohydrolase [Alkalihalobacillus sp. LMS39]
MKQLTIVGLGAGDLDQITVGIYRQLQEAEHVYVRTKHHPVLQELEKEGISFHSFDDIYEAHDSFETVYETISEKIIKLVENENITYAVPGHPLIAEQTVQLLIKKGKSLPFNINILGGQSFLDAMFASLQIDPIEGCQIVDGTALKKEMLQVRHHMIISQVYDAFIASEVKLTLMELLPDDYPVKVVTGAGMMTETIVTVPLFELDRVVELSNLTAVYVPPVQDEKLLYQDFSKLRDVIRTLRGPNGCPWDKEQTHESLKRYLIEEAYEVLEAIDEQDDDHLVEELGDVLLQVMLHAQIGEDDGWFSVDDVIRTLTEKMIRRHPHVFDTVNVENTQQVVKNWDEIKKAEKEASGKQEVTSILKDVPKGLPALMKANTIQKQAAKVGFDWNDVAPIWMKLQEELAEFFTEIKSNDKNKMTKELGDVLFVIVNLARYYNIEAEEALQLTNEKFKKRFQLIEQELLQQGLDIKTVPLETLDDIWEKTKLKYK